MKKDKLIKIGLLSLPILIGVYLIYKELSKNKTKTIGGVGGGGVKPPPSAKFEKYKVTTTNDPLNIRQSPDVSSADIGDLAKGSIIWAKPSGTSGWYEYSADGTTRAGYVSSDYIAKV